MTMTCFYLTINPSTHNCTPNLEYVHPLLNDLYGEHPTQTSHGMCFDRCLSKYLLHGEANGNHIYPISPPLCNMTSTSAGLNCVPLSMMLLCMLLARKLYRLLINTGLPWIQLSPPCT